MTSKKAANKKKFFNHWLENMSFDDFIKNQVENHGITDFYQMTSDNQCIAINKYYLTYDDLDASDLFYRRNGTDDLIAEIRKVLKNTATPTKFFIWLRSTIYENCLPYVQRAIEELVRERMPFSEAKGTFVEEL
jgi:hypothetical protein